LLIHLLIAAFFSDFPINISYTHLVNLGGNFWLCEEGGTTIWEATIWEVSPNGVLLTRYILFANFPPKVTYEFTAEMLAHVKTDYIKQWEKAANCTT
jgi:hypothetical protein